ncbi:MAG: hypothetical protein GZ091_03010 [Paludibacter sp.]|nr:hypothetical protein [Paludibacter sp.]
MKKYIIFFLVLLTFQTLSAKEWKLSDNNLMLTIDDNSLSLKVVDKRCNKVWEQTPFKGFELKKVTQDKNSLKLYLKGAFEMVSTIELNEKSEVVFSISANPKTQVKDFSFPSAFKSPNKNHYLLQTDGEGMLLPVDDTEYPLGNGRTYFCGGGLSMSWMGVTDTDFKTGYMAILETPYDAALETIRENGLISFRPVWKASLGNFGYDRKVKYVFFDKGGYVAQCKSYRDYIWKKNNVVTLKENQKKRPAIEKMLGAPHIYVWDTGREVSFAKELKASGIDKALFLWDANHTPYPVVGYDDSLKVMGYGTGAYELFTDLKLRDTVSNHVDLNGPMRLAHTSYPGLFNQLALRTKDGRTESNQFGHTSCPVAIRPEIIKRIDRAMKEFPHETYFLDVYQANGLFECYSDKHPLTRQQFAEAVNYNYKLIADKYNTYVGGEWGADYLGSNSVYCHGMMTLQRTWFDSDIQKKGTIYYHGDWKNNQRPSIQLSTSVAPDTYHKFSINEYTRVPLFELVYHDAIVTSWRWEDSNHHNPEIWWKKDLFNMLYGSAPLWSIDRDRWDSFKKTFVESYNKVCPWLQQICYDEMLSHRFVTTDHKVQESVFSSGKRIVVNFGEISYSFEGKEIKPKGYIIF